MGAEQSKTLWGAKLIAAAIGKSVRQTFFLLEKGYIPARKVGAQWVADRQVLADFLRGAPANDNKK